MDVKKKGVWALGNDLVAVDCGALNTVTASIFLNFDQAQTQVVSYHPIIKFDH